MACCRSQILDLATTVLGAAPNGDQPLMEAGLDSLGAVDLRNALSNAFGVELPPTATLDYPTVDALAKFIASSIAPAASNAIVDPGYWSDDLEYVEETAVPPTLVTGLSCIYPGMSGSIFSMLLRQSVHIARNQPCSASGVTREG